ncbi:hypothetical protein SRABI84_03037 [Peribacillus simplex]|nr:hypothetical protein SRABI84_03037 [Peribacillus simplex]
MGAFFIGVGTMNHDEKKKPVKKPLKLSRRALEVLMNKQSRESLKD